MQDTEISEREESAVSPYDRPVEAVLVENDEDEDEHLGWSEDYDISVSPNDFNVSTLCNFLDKRVIVIPDFQRDFVWDKRKASRFIESVTVGLPVPELFLYQVERNKWWVVDGQQRLMSIYYFRRGRFPQPGATVNISRLLRGGNEFSDEVWADNKSFSNFALDLSLRVPGGNEPGKLHGMSYKDIQDSIEIKPLRAIVIRQHKPDGDNAAFEIFDRLNTGGAKLSAHQIRVCVYQSPFLRMVDDLNFIDGWRALYGKHPEKNQRDAQTILRAFAMLSEEEKKEKKEKYESSMLRFLNNFCRKMQDLPESDEHIAFLRELFKGFLRTCEGSENMFRREKGNFLFSLFDTVFVAALGNCFIERRMPQGKINAENVSQLAQNSDFAATIQRNTTSVANVQRRLALARKIISPL